MEEHRQAPTSAGSPRAAERVGQSKTALASAGPPERLDRYLVLEMLGAGGMGEVLLAYDPALDRRVAIKLARLRKGDDTQSLEVRLQREAQALARVVDPHVVAVFDTGKVDRRPYVAMEYVPGTTLKGWLATARPRHEVLRVFVEAAKGLAAAHRVGVVHRDFKPDNVLMDSRSRARVTDFGLATFKDATPDEGMGAPEPGEDDMTQQVYAGTRSGAVLGTPGYMPPEQWDAQPTDARSDQFSFCVALHEALLGLRPFMKPSIRGTRPTFERAPDSLQRLREQLAALRKVLTRGLSLRPDDRYESMDALLVELEKLRRPSRLPWVVAATAVAAVGIGGAAWASRPVCLGAAGRIAAAREAVGPLDEKAQALAQGFEAAWAEASQTACVETTLRKAQPPQVLGLRNDCLRRQANRYRLVLEQLTRGEAATRATALEALESSPAPGDCLQVDTLLSARAPKAGTEAQVSVLRDGVWAARVAVDLGQFDDARARLDELAAPIAALGYGRLGAEHAFAQGALAKGEGDRRAARARYQAALSEGVAARDFELAATAGVDLLYVLSQLGEVEEAQLVDGLSSALVAQLGRGALEARLENSRGNVALERDHFDDAEAHFSASRRLAEAAHGRQHLDVARALGNLGVTLTRRDRPQQAEAPLREALGILEGLFGPAHPLVGQAQSLLSEALLGQGKSAEAVDFAERALATRREVLGPGHRLTRQSVWVLSRALLAAGRVEAARGLRTSLERTAPPDSLEAAERASQLGELEQEAGDLDAALRWCQLAQARFARHLEPGDEKWLWEALLLPLERAWRARDDADVRLADVLLLRAQALVLTGQLAAAQARAEEGRALYLKVSSQPARLAGVELVRAKVWWAQGKKAEARALARQARATLDALPAVPERAALDAWLAAHAPR